MGKRAHARRRWASPGMREAGVPDCRTVSTVIRAHDERLDMLERIGSWSDSAAREVMDVAMATRGDSDERDARRLVETAPVEDLELAWPDAPVAEIRAGRYENLRQLKAARDESLERRAGLDARLARRLRHAISTLERRASKSLVPRVEPDTDDPNFARMVRIAERAADMAPAQKAANEVLLRHRDRIEELVGLARPLTDPALWQRMHGRLRTDTRGVHSRELQRAADTAAVEACSELMDLLATDSEYRTSYNNIFVYGRRVARTDAGSAAAAWDGGEGRAARWMRENVPDVMCGTGGDVPVRDEASRERLRDLSQDAEALDAMTGAARHLPDSVRDRAFARIREQAEREVRDLPVERLRRSLPSKRPVTALRANGLDTVGAVMRLTATELAGLDGISQKSATDVLAACAAVCEQAASGLSVRMDPDDRTDAAGELVRSIDAYLRLRDTLDDRRRLALDMKALVEDVREDTACTKSELSWALAAPRERRRATDAFARMRSTLDGGAQASMESAQAHLRDVLQMSKSRAWGDYMADPVTFVATLEELVPELVSDDGRYGLPEHIAKDVEAQPLDLTGLSCTLRPYQRMGAKYALCQRRALLADEMGLGKTAQAIAVMVAARNDGARRMVVVCPASVLVNWQREMDSMSDLDVRVVHGQRAAEAAAAWHEDGGVALTTYMNAAKLPLDEDDRIDVLVVDEAHLIKHRNTKSAREVARIAARSERVLMMTGTPLENDVDEMLDLVERLNASVALALAPLADVGDTTTFRDAAAPVYYRRKREQVLGELPELVESDQWCEMGRLERKNYEAAKRDGNADDVRRLSWRVHDPRRHSSKARRLAEIVAEAKADGRKVLVFSHYLSTLDTVEEVLGDACVGRVSGAASPSERQAMVDSLETAPAGSVLACQIEAAGTGLNIQSASVIVICEPQLKPSTESQAISRAYRMGQTRNVIVYRLLCSDTDEEAFVRRLRDKQERFDDYADKSAAAEIDATHAA